MIPKVQSPRFFEATLAHYESKRKEAIATLELYFLNSVGISDHSNILDEITKWTEVLSQAEECIDSLKKNFSIQGSIRQVEVPDN